MIRFPGNALVLVGHGSTTNPDSSKPTRHLAEEIRGREIFDEVHCCFWKEEPPIRGILSSVASSEIYVVPNFISQGYFTSTVIPRELSLEGRITRREGKTVRYCDPVGSHPSMTSLLLAKARETACGLPEQETSLLIVGHGTPRDRNSSAAARHQAALLTKLNLYAEVLPAYMEESPLIADWASITSSPNVVVIPFFISDGLHSDEDIPMLLGIRTFPGPGGGAGKERVFGGNPHRLRGKSLYYSSAIGNSPGMADVILDQVRAF